MNPRAQTLRQALETAFAPQQLHITDESAQHAGHAGHGVESHFAVYMVAEAFTGVKALARQRLAQQAIAHVTGWHALSWVLRAPSEV